MSLAEAKLARQAKRIEQAEAALSAPHPLPLDRERQPSRSKGKTKWMPFDFTADSAATAATEAASNVEVRINTFRPPTRDSSISRSMSSLSQRTTGSASGIERQDPAQYDSSGFQLFTGRRSKRGTESLNAYETKQEPKQTTVEARVDVREIYEVFGNALPGSDFIQANPGVKEGQLQFVRHPNGDVSAHQWSIDRFNWDNIGQFSNIRKKVEGQLAADRLKGETAYQTLQQNTLAYFRTIAKQREATAMGLPFGAKEIQQLMPGLRPEQLAPPQTAKYSATAAASTNATIMPKDEGANDRAEASKEHNTEVDIHDSYSYMAYPGDGQASYGAYHTSAAHVPTGYGQGVSYPYPHPYHVPAGPRGERYNNNFFHGAPSGQLQDPFYAQNTYRSIYGGTSMCRSVQSSVAPVYGTGRPTPEGVPGFDYDWHFPAPSATGRSVRAAETQARNHRQSQKLEPAQTHTGTVVPQYGLTELGRTAVSSTRVQARQSEGTTSRFDRVGSQPTVATPLNPASRTAMRDQLWKLGEQAKERSLSQTNIRTVLYDPFRSHSDEPAEPSIGGQSKQQLCSELKRTVANPSGLPPDTQQSSTKSTVGDSTLR